MLHLPALRLCAMALFLLPALAATLTHRGADSLYCASSPNVQETNRDECYQAAVQMISQRSNCHNKIRVTRDVFENGAVRVGNCCASMLRNGGEPKDYSEDYLLAKFLQEIDQCVCGSFLIDDGGLNIQTRMISSTVSCFNADKRDLEHSDLQDMNQTLEDRSGIESCKQAIGPLIAQGTGWLVTQASTGAGPGPAGGLSSTQIADMVNVIWKQVNKKGEKTRMIEKTVRIAGQTFILTLSSFATMEGATWESIEAALGGSGKMWTVLTAAVTNAVYTGVAMNIYNIGTEPGKKIAKFYITKMQGSWNV